MLSRFKWLAIVMLMTVGVMNVYADKDLQVLIVAHANEGAYSAVVKGFKAQLTSSSRIRFSELFQPTGAAIAQEINQNKPSVIFAVGSDANDLAQQHSAGIPVISTLVLTEQAFKAGSSTGVSLTYPLATQIQWLKTFLPEQTRVAVLFNVVENAKTVQALKKVLEHAGLALTAIPVETPRQLPDALEQLANNVDVVLAIPDEIALSPKTAKEVLLASFRNRVPLVGLSENWVKSGALYALSWDYDDLGRQCAQQAQKLLNGQAIKAIAPETPRKITYVINMKIAEHMNLDISASLLQKAKVTFN
jgi:putative tryptophan/tyrosine transport system substrate-binding protein